MVEVLPGSVIETGIAVSNLVLWPVHPLWFLAAVIVEGTTVQKPHLLNYINIKNFMRVTKWGVLTVIWTSVSFLFLSSSTYVHLLGLFWDYVFFRTRYSRSVQWSGPIPKHASKIFHTVSSYLHSATSFWMFKCSKKTFLKWTHHHHNSKI